MRVVAAYLANLWWCIRPESITRASLNLDAFPKPILLFAILDDNSAVRTRTRTNTELSNIEANTAGRIVRACAARESEREES
jgi:hypothetical protein